MQKMLYSINKMCKYFTILHWNVPKSKFTQILITVTDLDNELKQIIYTVTINPVH